MSREKLEKEIAHKEPTGEKPTLFEIERKFLVQRVPDHLDQYPHEEILQGYLKIDEDGSEKRLRQAGERYTRTIKTGQGKTRQEQEEVISQNEFASLWPQTEGKRIEKTRYQIGDMEVDVYKGNLTGLIIAEKEFGSEEESVQFMLPEWVGEEVTNDERYKNKNLAKFGLPGN